MKKKYFLIIILATYSLNITFAQSSIAKIDKLAIKCSKGHIKSCEKLKFIANNDRVDKVRVAAVEKITDQNILFDIVKSGKYFITRLWALNSLSEHEYYNQIIDIINQKKETNHNLAAIGALKIIPQDKILKNNYEVLTTHLKIDQWSQEYFGMFIRRRMVYDIEIKTNKITKSFRFEGKKGREKELLSDIDRLHDGYINITEICEFLLSPLNKDDLLKISKESDVVYLRETATKMLKN